MVAVVVVVAAAAEVGCGAVLVVGGLHSVV